MKHTILLLLFLLLTSSIPAQAQPTFVEGVDYIRTVPTGHAVRQLQEQVEVIEFFWYACPHCYTLEPELKTWKKPPEAAFQQIPAVLGKDWLVHAYVFYTLETLKRMDLHAKVFHAIHNEKRVLTTAKSFAKYFDSLGEIKSDTFLKTFNSLAVDLKVKKGERIRQRYALRSVPTFVIQDRYIVSLSQAKGSPRRLFEIIDYLVALEAKKMKLDTQASPKQMPAEQTTPAEKTPAS